MAVQVRYNSWYISLPTSARRQGEMNKFFVVSRTYTATAYLSNFYFKFTAVFRIYFCDSFDNDEQSRWLKSSARFVGKTLNSMFVDVGVGVAVVVS